MKLIIEKNIPLPFSNRDELMRTLLTMNDGDSVYIRYEDFNKTVVNNCLANARLRVIEKGLAIRTAGERDGRRVWVLKQKEEK